MKLSLLLLLPLTAFAYTEPPCQGCYFNNTPDAEAPCADYGRLRTDLVRWHRASEACLTELNVTQAPVSRTMFWNACPTVAGNHNGLRAYLRNTKDAPSDQIRQLYPNFFTNVPNETIEIGFQYGLRNVISATQDQIIDCTLSVDLCWDAVGVYFNLEEGEMQRACQVLHSLQIPALLQEQKSARERLCGMDTTEKCNNLHEQIMGQKQGACTEFSKGPSVEPRDECGAAATTSGVETTSGWMAGMGLLW